MFLFIENGTRYLGIIDIWHDVPVHKYDKSNNFSKIHVCLKV